MAGFRRTGRYRAVETSLPKKYRRLTVQRLRQSASISLSTWEGWLRAPPSEYILNRSYFLSSYHLLKVIVTRIFLQWNLDELVIVTKAADEVQSIISFHLLIQCFTEAGRRIPLPRMILRVILDAFLSY